MEIRRAKQTEAQALSEIAMRAKAFWGYSDNVLEAWRSELVVSQQDIAAQPTFVATVYAEIVGFCSLRISRGSWNLDDLWVLPQFMRQGIGTALLSRALAEAFHAGATRVMVDADPHAERFYRERGAIRRGEVAAPITGRPERVRPQLVFTVSAT